MRKLALAAALFLMTRSASAQEITARALLAFERYDTNRSSTSGFRQTYDLRLDRAITDTARFRIFFRGDDFRGSNNGAFSSGKTGSRQLQPGAEASIDNGTLSFLGRTEMFDTRSESNRQEFKRQLERSSANLLWSPVGLPTLRLLGQRSRTNDTASKTELTDDSAIASLNYEWRGLSGTAEEHFSRSVDPRAGYDRRSTYHNATLAYAIAPFGGRLSVIADVSAQLMNLDETAAQGSSASVPTPVLISRALVSIDETPLDSRDQPPAPNPALTDNDLNRSAGVSLGPDAASFQNITLDVGHIDRLDEVRVLVRDEIGNPLRNGGGPVTFDVYTSQDGDVWTAVESSTSFNAALSLYAVEFRQISGRWLKIVNFGVNSEATFVSEVQANYHTTLRPGEHRRGNQTGYSGNATIVYRPWKPLLLSYTGLYSSIRQQLDNTPETSTSDLEHLASVEYTIGKSWAIRGQLLERDVRNFARTGDGAHGVTAFLDYTPTQKLRVTLEAGNQRQVLEGTSFTLETRAIHTTAYFLRSFYVGIDAGTQTQTISSDHSVARQQFINLTGNVQLWPTVRMQLNGTMQRARSESTDPAVQLLGPARDNRVSADVIWRPGRPLVVSVRTGWVSGLELSGITHRYHVEWFPFGGGTVSLATSYDQDIDPALNRKARRMVFNPRWLMNRHVALDLNYTSVKTTFDTFSNDQRALFATLTLSR